MRSLIAYLWKYMIYMQAGRSNFLTAADSSFNYHTSFLAAGDECETVFLSLNVIVSCPLATDFNSFCSPFTTPPPTCYINTRLKWAESGVPEKDRLPGDNLMKFCIYECCNWGCTSLLINYNWWKCGKGDSSAHNEAQWHRYHLIKKCCDKRRTAPNSQT